MLNVDSKLIVPNYVVERDSVNIFKNHFDNYRINQYVVYN